MHNRKIVHRLRGEKLEFAGMFRINGTSNPDNFRDGNTGDIESVTRVSAGLFTVKIRDIAGFILPTKLTNQHAEIAQAAAPTILAKAHIVRDSYDQTARTFQIQLRKVSDNTATDADDNDQVSFKIEGCLDSIGTDNVT